MLPLVPTLAAAFAVLAGLILVVPTLAAAIVLRAALAALAALMSGFHLVLLLALWLAVVLTLVLFPLPAAVEYRPAGLAAAIVPLAAVARLVALVVSEAAVWLAVLAEAALAV